MREHIRVFIASPGDVADERHAVFDVVSRLFYDPLLKGRISTEVVAWDGPFYSVPLLAATDPQSAIAMGLPKPSECDVVIVVLFSRLGTYLPAKFNQDEGTRPVTGTEWEYEEGLNASLANGGPEILVYRKNAPVPFDLQDTSRLDASKLQIEMVQQFFERMKQHNRGFNQFSTATEFATLLTDHLRALIQKRLSAPAEVGVRTRAWLADEGPEPSRLELVEFALMKLEEPHLRAAAAEHLAAEHFGDLEDHEAAACLAMATELVKFPSIRLAKAALNLLNEFVQQGTIPLSSLTGGAANKAWEVRSTTVSLTREYDTVDALKVYEVIGNSLSYWLPIQTLTEHILELSPKFGTAETARAVAVLETVLTNKKVSAKQRERIHAALTRLAPTTRS